MFRGADGKKNLLKIMGVILVCLAILLAFRALIDKKSEGKPTTGTTIENVITKNSVSIPEFDGETYVMEINGNEPFFTDDEITNEYFLELSDFDENSRAQTAWMCADEAHIRTEERDSDLSKLEPSGWKKNAIYQRSHLLMWKLSGPDDLKNLITGTEYFNQTGMLQYEEQVTAYLWDNEKNHVMYRVTPYYIGTEKVARGVLMEAYSVEDNGKLHFCVFVYNAQPDTVIEYDSGVYHEDKYSKETLENAA